jgi:hypothetical protein
VCRLVCVMVCVDVKSLEVSRYARLCPEFDRHSRFGSRSVSPRGPRRAAAAVSVRLATRLSGIHYIQWHSYRHMSARDNCVFV